MSGYFKKPKAATPAATTPTPDRSDAEVQSAAANQRAKYYGSSRGGLANRLTSGLGIPGSSMSSAAVQVLGLSGA